MNTPRLYLEGLPSVTPKIVISHDENVGPPLIFHRLVVLFPRHYIDQDLAKQFFGHFGCAVHFSIGMANIWHDILSTGQR